LVETLREYEQEEGGRFHRMQKEWDDQFTDSDDVFFAAKKRKEEIKKQVRNLQRGLDRVKPRKAVTRFIREKKVSRK